MSNTNFYLNQTDNIVKLLWNNNNIYSCYEMFEVCSDITEIDLSNFDTSNVQNMNEMFRDCISLTSFNFSNFITSKVLNMGSVFYNCSSLTSLNLSNFNTSNVIHMHSTFAFCSSLTSLDLSNFITSNVQYTNAMFYGCKSLTSLNLSNFDTSSLIRMNGMFAYCSSLKSLDLSNFNTSKVTYYMYQIFDGCSSLEYINLNNFRETGSPNVAQFFRGVPDNIVVCINETYNYNISNQLKTKSCFTIDCSFDWKKKQKKIVNKADICWNNSDNNILYKYEYNLNGLNTGSGISCSDIPSEKDLCIPCNNSYFIFMYSLQ